MYYILHIPTGLYVYFTIPINNIPPYRDVIAILQSKPYQFKNYNITNENVIYWMINGDHEMSKTSCTTTEFLTMPDERH
jgi:hypothetical protein